MATDPRLTEARARLEGAGFLDCPKCFRESGTDWIVFCRFDGARPYIAALICAECDTELSIEGGVVAGVKHGQN